MACFSNYRDPLWDPIYQRDPEDLLDIETRNTPMRPKEPMKWNHYLRLLHTYLLKVIVAIKSNKKMKIGKVLKMPKIVCWLQHEWSAWLGTIATEPALSEIGVSHRRYHTHSQHGICLGGNLNKHCWRFLLEFYLGGSINQWLWVSVVAGDYTEGTTGELLCNVKATEMLHRMRFCKLVFEEFGDF